MPPSAVYLNLLREEVKIKAGIHLISFSQCRHISQLMAASDIHLSAHTLARFFGVLQPGRLTYVSTLDLVARYVGYKHWNDFVLTKEQQQSIILCNDRDKPDPLHYLMVQLRYALTAKDYPSINQILDRAASDGLSQNWQFTHTLGWHCRTHSKDRALFRILSQSPVGREVFYRTFVDEDNMDGYFSHYLGNFFLKTGASDHDQIFALSYINSHGLYRHKKWVTPPPGNWNEPDTMELIALPNSFHIISRHYELRLLAIGNNRYPEHLIEKIIAFSQHYPPRDFAWIMGRALKALYFRGFSKPLMADEQILNACENILKHIPGELHTTAEQMVQLHYLAAKRQQNAPRAVQPKITLDILSSSNERMVLEHLTMAFLDGDNISGMAKQCEVLSSKLGQLWAFPILQNLFHQLLTGRGVVT